MFKQIRVDGNVTTDADYSLRFLKTPYLISMCFWISNHERGLQCKNRIREVAKYILGHCNLHSNLWFLRLLIWLLLWFRDGAMLVYHRLPWREPDVPYRLGVLYEDDHLVSTVCVVQCHRRCSCRWLLNFNGWSIDADQVLHWDSLIFYSMCL